MNIDDILKGKLYLDTVWSKVESVTIRCISKTENNACFVIEEPGKNGDGARRNFNRIECDIYVCKHPKENYSNESPTPLSEEEILKKHLNNYHKDDSFFNTVRPQLQYVIDAMNENASQQTAQLRQQVEEKNAIIERADATINHALDTIKKQSEEISALKERNEKMERVIKEALEAFNWTWENMGNPHTPDHFNIPANGINALEQLLNNKHHDKII